MARLIRVRDDAMEYDWPEDALLPSMTPIEGYPANLTGQPRMSKPRVPLGGRAEGDQPNQTWLKADVETYATERGIDLAGATTKADMLAAIADPQTTPDTSGAAPSDQSDQSESTTADDTAKPTKE